MTNRKKLLVILLAMVLTCVTAGCNKVPDQNTGSEAKVTIIKNASVEQVVEGAEAATAVVIKDDEIAYVGDDEGAMVRAY